MRNLIISFAIAVTMTSLFTTMVGSQVGMVANAARGHSNAPLVDVGSPVRVGANRAAPGADHPAT